MKFVAFERTLQGTGASRRLRNAGKVPGIVYGGTEKPQTIELDHNALFHALKKEVFHASILEMELAGKTQQVLLRDYSMHPFKPIVLHIDFQRVDPNKKIHMKVPLHFSGEADSPAVKLDAALITHVINDIEVACLPKDLPEFIAVDLSGLTKGSSIHASDLKLPAGVTVVTHGKNTDPMIVSVITKGGSSDDEAKPAEAAAPAAKAAPAKDAKAAAAPAKAPAAKK